MFILTVAAALMMKLDCTLDADKAIKTLRELRGPSAVQSVKVLLFFVYFYLLWDNIGEVKKGMSYLNKKILQFAKYWSGGPMKFNMNVSEHSKNSKICKSPKFRNCAFIVVYHLSQFDIFTDEFNL